MCWHWYFGKFLYVRLGVVQPGSWPGWNKHLHMVLSCQRPEGGVGTQDAQTVKKSIRRAPVSSLSGHKRVHHLDLVCDIIMLSFRTLAGWVRWSHRARHWIDVLIWRQDWEQGRFGASCLVVISGSRHGLVSLGIGCSWHSSSWQWPAVAVRIYVSTDAM